MEITNESKDIISSYYYKIVAAPTDYDNISKSDMLNEIIKIYHNPQNIIDICTEKELTILNKISKNEYTYQKEDLIILDNLVEKLLIDDILNPKLTEEFKEGINVALENINMDRVRKNDFINELAVPYIKILGYTDKDKVIDFIANILTISKKEVESHFKTNKLFNFYVDNSELKILKEFNKGKIGNFVIAKFELNYTILIDAEDDTKLYKIKGLTSNIDEIIDDIPRFASTAIMPFKGYIIYDGLFSMADIDLGLTFKKSVKNALKNGKYQNYKRTEKFAQFFILEKILYIL